MRRCAAGLAVLFIAAALVSVWPGGARANGSLVDPPSRLYACRFLERFSPACANLWESNPQALFDWMDVSLPDVAGRHRQAIPNGQLCSAGQTKYAALDRASQDWPVTDLVALPSGIFRLTYQAIEAHPAEYVRVYLTREGFNSTTNALGWADLELVYTSRSLPAADVHEFDILLPPRTGQQILYTIFQRSDSPEAFYACADVRLLTVDGRASTTLAPDGGNSLTTMTTRRSTTSTLRQSTTTTEPSTTTTRKKRAITISRASSTSSTTAPQTSSTASTTSTTEVSTTTSSTSSTIAESENDTSTTDGAVVLIPRAADAGDAANTGGVVREVAADFSDLSSTSTEEGGSLATVIALMASGLLAIAGITTHLTRGRTRRAL